jgi:hypothetical protein
MDLNAISFSNIARQWVEFPRPEPLAAPSVPLQLAFLDREPFGSFLFVSNKPPAT